MRVIRGAFVVLVALAALSPARAAEENIEQAKQYFAAGVEAYDQGKYEVALREFQHAHALSHSPALYFNMAACEEHMDHFQAAGLLLRQYLIEKPDADDRQNVELRIKSLEERDERLHKIEPEPQVKPTPGPATMTTTATPQPEAPRRHLKYTWVMLGVTAGVGIAAIGVGAYTLAHHDSLKTSCGKTPAGCSTSQIDGLKSTAVATDVLIGVAAAAAIATVAFAIVETRKSPTHARRAADVAFVGNGVTF